MSDGILHEGVHQLPSSLRALIPREAGDIGSVWCLSLVVAAVPEPGGGHWKSGTLLS